MRIVISPTIALVVGTSLAAAAAFGQAPIPPADVSHEVPAIPKALTQPKVPHPAHETAEEEDLEVTQSALGGSPGALRPAAISVAAGTNLTPPVTITYSGSSSALTINDSGTYRGLSSVLTNTTNSNSAVYGETQGTAAGIKGINSGVSGLGGSFSVTNSANPKPALYAATYGTGSAIIATNRTLDPSQPAILATNAAPEVGNPPHSGIAVEGVANYIGLYGVDNSIYEGFGVYGFAPHATGVGGISTAGAGVYGASTTNTGVAGISSTGAGVSGYSTSSNGVVAASHNLDALNADSVSGHGIRAHSFEAFGIFASSDNSNGIWGQSKNHYGVAGVDLGTGVGIYGKSASGYAGQFDGKVIATAYLTNSDRNAKTGFKPVDGDSVLELVSRLPISSWAFKEDPKQRHIGPMAQDFHAAFGLSGADDKHINLSDAAGVSLAAIQELNKRLQEKDARIAALEGQLKSMNDAFSSMKDSFSSRLAKLEEQANPQTVTASVPSGR